MSDTQTQTTTDPIELIIVNGFLGAGKTTLINKLLAEGFGNADTALLENEFGDVAIDDKLIDAASISVRTMATGCICCTLRGDFVRNVIDIVQTYKPKRIIIEPTGLANLADILSLCDETASQVPLDLRAIITVVNAETLLPTLAVGGDFFTDQLAQARFIVVSCSQLVDEEDLEDVLGAIHEHHPRPISILDLSWDEVSAVEIMTLAEQALEFGDQANFGQEKTDPKDDHQNNPFETHQKDVGHVSQAGAHYTDMGDPAHSRHDGDAANELHDHDHHDAHHHDAQGRHVDEATGCVSIAFSPSQTYTPEQIDEIINAFKDNQFGTVFRAKGFLHTDADPLLVEYVYSAAHVSPSTYAGDSIFVIIGRDLDVDGLESLFGRATA